MYSRANAARRTGRRRSRPAESRRLPTAERRTCSFARQTRAALPDADCGRNCESPHDVHGFRGSGARRRGKRPPPKSNCNISGMERKSARVYAAEPPPRPETDCAALRGAFFPQQACAPSKERAPAYTAEYARPFASYAPRRLRRAFPPDSAASRYRPGSHLQTHQADRHP